MLTGLIQRLESADQSALPVRFQIDPLPGTDKVHRIVVTDQEEFPIALTQSDDELLCMVQLFTLEEVTEAQLLPLYETLLTGNLSMPFSSFGITGGACYLFGSLSARSDTEIILQEIVALADNTVQALELVEPFLRQGE